MSDTLKDRCKRIDDAMEANQEIEIPNDWELGFIKSNLKKNYTPSPKQDAVLKKIEAKVFGSSVPAIKAQQGITSDRLEDHFDSYDMTSDAED